MERARARAERRARRAVRCANASTRAAATVRAVRAAAAAAVRRGLGARRARAGCAASSSASRIARLYSDCSGVTLLVALLAFSSFCAPSRLKRATSKLSGRTGMKRSECVCFAECVGDRSALHGVHGERLLGVALAFWLSWPAARFFLVDDASRVPLDAVRLGRPENRRFHGRLPSARACGAGRAAGSADGARASAWCSEDEGFLCGR